MTISSSTGLATGIDTDSLVSQLMNLERRPISLLQTKISKQNSMTTAIESINRQLTSLKSQVNALNELKDFNQFAVSSTDSKYVSVTANDPTVEGSYNIEVLQLAKAERIGSQGFIDQNISAIASSAGKFSFKLGTNGAVHEIDVDDTTTLADIRDAINTEDAGVRASIINDGSSTNSYRLILTSVEAGTENDIYITQNDTTLNFDTSTIEGAVANGSNSYLGDVTSSGTYTGSTTKNYVIQMTTGGSIGVAKFKVSEDGGLTWSTDDAFTTNTLPVNIFKTSDEGVQISFDNETAEFAVGDRFYIDAFNPQIQEAQDAIVSIDGVQVRSSSNEFEDAIDGVTFRANKITEEDEPINITIVNDTNTVKSRVQNLVNAYNSVVNEIKRQTSYDTETNTAGALFGDATARNISMMLSSIITSKVPGISTGLNSLGSIGISTQSNGTLTLDSTKLDEIVADADKFEQFKALFSVKGSSQSTYLTLVSAESSSYAGSHSINITQAAEQAKILGNQAISTSGITDDETLTFSYGGGDTPESVTVYLEAGDKLADIIEKINNQMIEDKVQIRASDEGGFLSLKTEGYGSAEEFTVKSNKNGAVDTQSGIGTTERSDTGVNVEGTIDGYAATGNGEELEANEGTPLEGMKIKVTATTTGNVGSIDVSYGVAQQLLDSLNLIIDPTDGMLVSKKESISSTIDSINNRIETIEARLEKKEETLRAQFNRMEVTVSQYQSIGNFLTNFLTLLNY